MEHMLYLRQGGGAQKAGIVGIQYKTQKTGYGIKIRKVKELSPKWQWASVEITSAFHTV